MSDTLVIPVDAELANHIAEIVRISVQAGKDAAAQALTEARAEIERMNAQVDEALRSCLAEREGRLKAEAAISTLRARVREVVGPFASFDHATTSNQADKCVIARGRVPSILTLADFEAARQLMEEVK